MPWAYGETLSAGLADTNMGNSLVTYVSGTGFRALDLTTEYTNFFLKTANNENVREALASDFTGLSSQTVNALVLHNAAVDGGVGDFVMSGNGAGQGWRSRLVPCCLL